jgi:SAM-dependent methyltransferase
MNIATNPARLKAAATYDAAADHFDAPALAFWDRHGRRTVALLGARAGDRVLDVGCGTGASAIPAAVAVGANGHVTGIDIAENMLARARAKAAAQGLNNTTFRLADMSASGLPDAGFDSVISVFSVFFVPDIERQVAELWRMLRPGGRLAVTVWARGAFDPGAAIFGEEVRRVRPDLPVAGRPWERLTDPDNLRRLLQRPSAADGARRLVDDRYGFRVPLGDRSTDRRPAANGSDADDRKAVGYRRR